MLRFAFLAVSCLAVTACATITRGTRETFVVETIPSGAHVRLSSGEVCEATPCTFPRISREAEFSVTVSKPGYRTTIHQVSHQMSGGGGAGMAGNVLLGGIIGGAIDANSGATQELVPNPLTVHLELEATPVAAPAASSNAAPAPTQSEAPAAPVETLAPAE